MKEAPTLIEGSTCWRIARADRAAFIIDAEDYFGAVYEAIRRARHCVFIVGWDIHSQLRLVRSGDEDSEHTLGALLDSVAQQQPSLDIYVLSWDFSMLYTMEREPFPEYKLRWKSHDRVHFCLDGEHPAGASQHQKLVVIDDRLAFCGGIDLTKSRWDTSAHSIDDDRRVDPSGQPYPPFHDVQMAVDAEAARTLGVLVRERWRRAARSAPKTREEALDADPWPVGLEPTLTDVDVGIARTLPAYRDRKEVTEVENLYLESIAAARRFIYIENQYLSAHRVGKALAQRLREPDGPEVIIVTPQQTGGWLEQHTMDILRARWLRDVREADAHDRLRVFVAQLSEHPKCAVMIHAKVMIIDDRFARVASSNLSNRSMGLDSECDLALESTRSQDCREAITAFRRRLLCEHLGVSTEAMAESERSHPSLIAAIDSLRGNARSLEPLRNDIPPEVDEWVPDATLLDPEKPVSPDELFDYFVGPEQRKPLRRNLQKLVLLSLALLALLVAWRWTPLGELARIDALTAMAEWLQSKPFAPVLALATFVAAASLGVPVTLLIVATVAVFGPVLGACCSLVGAELAAFVSFGLGHLLGRDAVSRLAGSRINQLSRRLADRGVLTTFTLRIIPVAPFAVINVIAGASKIRFRDFALGNLIGILPAVLLVALLTDRILASLREPGRGSVGTLVIAIVAAVTITGALRHWLRAGSNRSSSHDVE